MNKPLLEGPDGWVMNISSRHRETETIYLHTPTSTERHVELKCHCMFCMHDHIKDLFIGPPISLTHSFPVEALEELGIVGLYTHNSVIKREIIEK